jgi:hypothetical protein
MLTGQERKTVVNEHVRAAIMSGSLIANKFKKFPELGSLKNISENNM